MWRVRLFGLREEEAGFKLTRAVVGAWRRDFIASSPFQVSDEVFLRYTPGSLGRDLRVTRNFRLI